MPFQKTDFACFRLHLAELSLRGKSLAFAFMGTWCIAYLYAEELLYLLTRPLMEATSQTSPSLLPLGLPVDRSLIFTNLTEAFTTHLLLAFYASFLLLMPFLFLQIWLFLEPGLFPQEAKLLGRVFFFSPILFGLGGWVAYVYLLPLAWAFLTGFESRGSEVILQIHLEAKLSEYLPLALQMQLGLGLLFQYPLFLVSFLASGLICRKDMVQYRKVCFLLSFLVGACLSPPDLGAQCLIAFPLIFFYEGSLWGAGLWERYLYESSEEGPRESDPNRSLKL
jgi:sec-independent protein translocase protein TatC